LLSSCAHADPVKQPGLYRTCYYEAFHRAVVLQSLGMASTQYLLPESQWQNTMPTWRDEYRQLRMQGQVSDSNAYALGGIAGHAGIFSSAQDMGRFISMWGFSAFGAAPHALINSTTARLFTTNPNPVFGPRALGWLTQAPTDPYMGCGNWSADTFYHTGYTGTLICADPTRNITLVLLTNRVYPNATGEMEGIHVTRQRFADAVLQVLGL
jgi:CubicO group peptidase (beta-lactamase class C family)